MAKTRGRSPQQRLRELHGQACKLEEMAKDRKAEDLFRECLVLAEQMENPLTVDHLRWHIGASLLRQERFRQCLAVLTPLVQGAPPYTQGEKNTLCPGITGGMLPGIALFHFCLASMALPSDWPDIERCLDRVGDFVERLGRKDGLFVTSYWFARLSYLERSGRYLEGLREAKQAAARVHKEHRRYLMAFAALLAAQAGEVRQAQDYLAQVRNGGNDSLYGAELAEVILARRAGDAGRAVSLSGWLKRAGWLNRQLDNWFYSFVWQVESHLAAGDLVYARSLLGMIYFRCGRSATWRRLELLRLIAEYRLALARREAALPDRDCRYLQALEQYREFTPTPVALRQAATAVAGFARATRMARRIVQEAGLPLVEALNGRRNEADRLRAALLAKGGGSF